MSQTLRVFNGSNAPQVRPIPWLVPGFLARGAGTILFGQPGVSKTAHTAILCASIWNGTAFGAFPALEPGLRVLYVDLDGGWDWSAPLFYGAFRGVGLEGLPEEFNYYSPLTRECFDVDPVSGKAKEPGLITLEEHGLKIAATVKELKIDLVVIDSLGQFMSGDSNSSQDVSLALRMGLNPARAEGAAVLVIDHATKSARQGGQGVPTPAGSQQKRAWARCTVAIEEEEYNGADVTRWSVDKTNTQKFEPFLTKLHFQNSSDGQLETLTLELLGDAGERNKPAKAGGELAVRKAILEKLADGEARTKDFPNGGTYTRVLKMFVESGEILKSKRGVYCLPENPSNQPNPENGAMAELEVNPANDSAMIPPTPAKVQEHRPAKIIKLQPTSTTAQEVEYDL
jgi:hypothetical protein